MKLIINRATWLRGEGSMGSRLLRPDDGKMCCLGFFAVSVGCTTDQISDVARPDWDQGIHRRFPRWLVTQGVHTTTTGVCERLMRVNDDPLLDGGVREANIRATFAEHGVEVEFIEDALKAPTDSMSVHDPSTDDRIEQ